MRDRIGELPPMGWNDEARGAKPSWEHAGKRLRTMLRLLTAKQRIALVALTGGRIVMGMCDLLLAYAMYLLFFLLQNGHAVVQRRWLPETLLATAVATLGMVVIRLLVDLLSTRSLIRYTQGLYADFIRRLVAGYHAMRWNEFTRRNRSELLKHATATALDASYAYQLLIDLVSSVMVMLGLAASLVFQNPWVACGLVAMTGFFYGLHRCVIRARLREAAADRETAARGLQAVLVEIFASAKEIRTYRNQVYFHGRVTRQVERLGASNVRLGLLPQFSRLVAEQGVVALFLLVIIGVELRHATVNNLLSILVFYFILSRRLLPLISQIGLTLGMVEGAYENIQIVERELRDCANHVEEPLTVMQPSTGWAMELECVSFAFEADTPLLREISLDVRVGEMVTLCGASGGGKSSLLNLIAGISQPDAGTVRVDPGSVAYVPQEITLLDDSVRSNLLFGLADRQDAELMEVLAKAKLKDFIVGLPLGLETRVGDNGILFSGGQRQRLGLARALLRGAKLLLLDEATSALDEENEREILGNIIAKGGPAVLLVTHREHGRHRADRVYRLEGGKLLDESPAFAVEALS